MAFRLEKQKTTSTPYILIDEEKGYMRIEGRSFHENVIDIFKDVTDWLDGYLKTDFESLTFDCMMDYFNSSTVKVLLNIIMKMDKRASENKSITINWITHCFNEIIIECGEDLREDIVNLTFNLVINDE